MSNVPVYKTIYIYSVVGEYELKHSKEFVDLYELEEFDKATHDQLQRKIKDQFNPDCEVCRMHYMTGTKEQLISYAKENADYLLEILNGPYGVGADDGHYDYFPDLVEQFMQLCKALKLKELYNATLVKITSHHEYNDEDEEVGFETIKELR